MSTSAATVISRFSKYYLSKKRLYELKYEMNQNGKKDSFMKMMLKHSERIEKSSSVVKMNRKPPTYQECKALADQLELKMKINERDFVIALEDFKIGKFERNCLDNKDLDNSRHQNLIKHEVIEIADMVENIQQTVQKQD